MRACTHACMHGSSVNGTGETSRSGTPRRKRPSAPVEVQPTALTCTDMCVDMCQEVIIGARADRKVHLRGTAWQVYVTSVRTQAHVHAGLGRTGCLRPAEQPWLSLGGTNGTPCAQASTCGRSVGRADVGAQTCMGTTHRHAYMCAGMQVRTHTGIHAHAHTYLRTYLRTYLST